MKLLPILTIAICLSLSNINTSSAQDYRLQGLVSYLNNNILDSVQIQYGWNRSPEPNSFFELSAPFDASTLSHSNADTFIWYQFASSNEPVQQTYSHYDFDGNLKERFYFPYQKESYFGYGSDTFKIEINRYNNLQQTWNLSIYYETVYQQDVSITTTFVFRNGQLNPSSKEKKHSEQFKDSTIYYYYKNDQWNLYHSVSHHYDPMSHKLIYDGQYSASGMLKDVTTYTYHDNGKLKSRIHKQIDTTSTNIIFDRRSSLNASGDFDTVHVYYHSGTQVTGHFYARFSYDSLKRVKKIDGMADPSYPVQTTIFDSIRLEYIGNTSLIAACHFDVAQPNEKHHSYYYTYETFKNNVGISKVPMQRKTSTYPNPTKGTIILSFDEDISSGNLFIYDTQGKECARFNNFENGASVILPTHLIDGIYSYRFVSQGSMNSGKIQLAR